MLKSFRPCYLATTLTLATFAALVPSTSFGPSMPQGAVSEPSEFNYPPALAVPSESEVRHALLNPRSVKPLSPAFITPETLWMARAMYSESKRAEEQELVAWVIRNRLDTGFLGAASIEDVVLSPFQFSAFNPGNPVADYYVGLDVLSEEKNWQRTLALAYYVQHAESSLRPFAPTVRHFHSPQAMKDPGTPPIWTRDSVPVQPSRAFELNAARFRFFANVD